MEMLSDNEVYRMPEGVRAYSRGVARRARGRWRIMEPHTSANARGLGMRLSASSMTTGTPMV